MDLIRIFIDTAFSKLSNRYFDDDRHKAEIPIEDGLFDVAMFVEECRCHHPELSDDQIRVMYQLYADEWSDGNLWNIFEVLTRFSHEVLRLYDGEPLVRFENLFRWRETSQIIGEDLLVSAFLAYTYRETPDDEITYWSPAITPATPLNILNFANWPTILHNDNPELAHIFQTRGLCELHSHLYASTDNFSLSWVCLMNGVSGRISQFETLASEHDKIRASSIAKRLYGNIFKACALRYNIWAYLQSGGNVLKLEKTFIDEEDLDNNLSSARFPDNTYDYIPCCQDSEIEVFTGERRFLFDTLRRILKLKEKTLIKAFYEYVLIKNSLRQFLVQINSNRGFSNFQRYQNLKGVFLTERYFNLIPRLAAYEAAHFNYGKVLETRIIPKKREDVTELVANINEVFGAKKDEFESGSKSLSSTLDRHMDLSILFHFIKSSDYNADGIRHSKLRDKIRTDSRILKNLLLSGGAIIEHIKGIDAASSEINCRPEVFGQAFRYLKRQGYHATFHAGEDFYDIADGLRAIDESILYLELESHDRIGHAIALGIDAHRFYKERHSHIVLPKQWMLDNIVWLFFKAMKSNISIDPETSLFLKATYRELIRDIGYGKSMLDIDIRDYHWAMLLRGDNPHAYISGEELDENMSSPDWSFYEFSSHNHITTIRKNNSTSRRLHLQYLTDRDIKERGAKVKSYEIPKGYIKMIKNLQEAMIREISEKRIGIECCPSSNVKIGYLDRFDCHPIFRFLPVNCNETRHPLAVTVNTDDLGMFATSLPNEFSLLALALLKTKDGNGNRKYSSQEVYDWIDRIVVNGHIYKF